LYSYLFLEDPEEKPQEREPPKRPTQPMMGRRDTVFMQASPVQNTDQNNNNNNNNNSNNNNNQNANYQPPYDFISFFFLSRCCT
jgi:hypothetical protein